MSLSPEEDEELRRINVMAQFGDLPPLMIQRFVELRSRDRRMDIREPTLDVRWVPRQRGRKSAADDEVVAEGRPTFADY